MEKPYDNLTDLATHVICEHNGAQFRLTISEFREKHYIGIRKYYLSYDSEWLPTKEGVSFPYNLHTTSSLFSALCSLLSEAEVLNEITKHMEETRDPAKFIGPKKDT